MKLDKFAIVVLLTLLIGGAAYYFSQEEAEQREDKEGGNIYSSALSKRINNVAAIRIREKNSETNLVLQNDQWILKEKSGYPADFPKVAKMIIDVSEFKTIESKTSEPEKYARLGVQPVGDPGDVDSKQIDFMDKAGNIIESMIIGKNKDARAPGSGSALYVRKTSDAKSWLVAGTLSLPDGYVDWLDKSAIDIKAADIKKVEIKHPDNSRLVIEKASKDDKNFVVLDKPEQAKLQSDSIANGLANGLQGLTFIDVMPRKDFMIDNNGVTVIEFSTYNGLKIMAKLLEKEDKHFLLLDTRAMVEDQVVKDNAVMLGSRFAQWAYEIAAFKATSMKKKLEDLLEKKE